MKASPLLPEPNLRLVTEPGTGYRVKLEPGVHTAVVVDGENRIPGKARTIHVHDASEARRSSPTS